MLFYQAFFYGSIKVSAQNFSKIITSSIPPLTNAKSQWVDFNNDIFLDLFISGTNGTGGLHTAVYISNGNNTFNVINLTPLTDVAFDFGDYNKDGFIDILLSGVNVTGEKKTILYRNTNGNGFSVQATSLENLSKGGVLWRDFDNDTDLDLILTGLNISNQEKTFVYEYTSGLYNIVNHTLPNVSNGALSAFDANNDDHIELLLTGLNSSGLPVSNIYTFHNNFNNCNFKMKYK